MQPVMNLSKVLLVGCAFFALSFGHSLAAEPEGPAATVRTLLTAVESNNYDVFEAQEDAAFKAAFPKQVLRDVNALLSPRMKNGYISSYFGTFKRQGFTIHLWKLTYEDGGDDTLGKRRFIRFCRSRVGGNPVESSIWIPAFAGMTN